MATATQSTVSYKGHTYRLLWQGATKYGQRAHLQFLDGSKDFWVDAAAVGASSSSRRGRSRHDREDEECELCGKNKYTCGHCIGW